MPWSRRRARSRVPDASDAAVAEASAALEESEQQGVEAASLIAQLRALRETNHFSERLTAMLQAHHG
jgi:hypothetical protein